MKSREQRHPKRSPRVPEIVLGAAKDTTIDTIELKNGRVVFKDEHGLVVFDTIAVGRSYVRRKGLKTVERFPADPSDIVLEPRLLLQQYGSLVVVDTNYRSVGPNRLCASSSIWIPANKGGGFKGATAYHQSTLISLVPERINPEIFGWQDIIERTEASPIFDSSKEHGVAVDSELGLLTRLNERVSPIIGGFFLPNEFQLLYVSADAKGSTFLSDEIRLCDKQATQVLKQLLAVSHFQEEAIIMPIKIAYVEWINAR